MYTLILSELISDLYYLVKNVFKLPKIISKSVPPLLLLYFCLYKSPYFLSLIFSPSFFSSLSLSLYSFLTFSVLEGESEIAKGLLATKFTNIGDNDGDKNDVDKVVFLFARQGAAQFLYCGRCKVVEVELPSSRSSLVKLTFELIDFDILQKDVKSHIPSTSESSSRIKKPSQSTVDCDNDVSGDTHEHDVNRSRKNPEKIESKVSSNYFTELVSTHREEMEVLFGAYSRAAVEEKRLQRLTGL